MQPGITAERATSRLNVAYLDEAKTTLLGLHERLQEFTGPFDLPEPDPDMRAAVQRIVDNEVAHVPTR